MSTNTENKLVIATCTSAQAKEILYSLPDGGGLRLFITPKGTKSWRYKYRFAGKYKTLVIGGFPAVKLKEARELRNVARRQVSEGVDPAVLKQLKKSAVSDKAFQSIAESWIKDNSPNWSATHLQRTESYLTRDVYPVIGKRDIGEIEFPELIGIIKSVAARGAVDSAKRLKALMGQVFEYGILHGACRRNPAADVKTRSLGLPKTIKQGYAAITTPEKLGELLRATDNFEGGISSKTALQLAPFLGLRPTELSSGEWSEINFETAQWVLPAKRRKLPVHLKKANRVEDAHIVPLPRQAIEILKKLHEFTGRGKHMFPSLKGDSRPISNNTLRAALRTMGFSNDDHTPHGYRHTVSTMLNDMGYRERIIEAQLSHALKSQIEGSYNRATYIAERTNMMQEWADYLDNLKAANNVLSFKQRA